MSLTRRTYSLLTALVLIHGIGGAQLITDQGLLSGSGLSVIPTATIAPASEFQLQLARTSYTREGGTGVNILDLCSGLSESLEGYLRVTGEQLGTFSSEVSYGFGAKFRLPLLVPLVRHLALWTDITSSDQVEHSGLFPSQAFRSGVTATFDSNGIHPTVLVGFSKTFGRTHALLGGGVTIAAGSRTQFGVEFVHGYLGPNSAQIAATASTRLFSNISLHLSPGYISVGDRSTASLTFGVSFSTTDVDFHPSPEQRKSDDFILPSIEEIERQQKQSSQKPGGGSMLIDPQSPDTLKTGYVEPTISPDEEHIGNASTKNSTATGSSGENKKQKELKKEEFQRP